MNQAIQKIVDTEALAIEILLRAEKVAPSPMGCDQQRYHQSLLNQLKLKRARLIFGRMEQERDTDKEFAKAHGQQRLHSVQEFPVGPKDRKVVRAAVESINDDIDRIKFWLKTEPALTGKTGEDLIIAAVEFFHNQRAK